MSRQPNATPQFTLIQGLYWMAYCILVSFSSVYLLERGFSNSQIGLLISVSSILSAVLQPVAAARADRLALGWDDPLEEGMETHFSILAWRIPMDRGA